MLKRKVFRTLAFSVLFCALLCVAVFAENAEVTGNEVNFRTGPGTEYSIFDCLPSGTVVTVTDMSNSEWYAVTYGGHSGFIYAIYLDVEEAPAPAAPAAQPQQTATAAAGNGSVNAMYVRFRSGPGTDYSVLGEYNTGTALTVTGSSGEWYAVTINGKTGYMYASYVSLVSGAAVPAEQPAATPEPTPAPTPVPTPAPTPAPAVVTASDSVPGHVSGDYVYFRSGPSTNYSIYDCLANGTKLTITGTSDNWTAVTYNGRSGFIFSSYVVSDGGAIPVTPVATPEPVVTPAPAQTTKSGFITGNSVRFRSGPSTRDEILGEYNYGTALTITGYSGEWTAVTLGGRNGYVYSQYVSEGSATDPEKIETSSDFGRQVVEYALQFEGCPYVWGGMSPAGFDCSGFTSYVFAHFGITLNRVADDQTNDGTPVDNSDLQPGDLLCFYSSSNYVGHVGIYIGNNRFIHASTYTTGVIISELNGYYDTRGFIARRLG